MQTPNLGNQTRIFTSLPNVVQEAIVAYADEAKLLPQAVIEFAIANFLELDSIPMDKLPRHAEDGSNLADLPASLRTEIQQYATETEMPPEFVVELAIAHFLDPDSVTFDDCEIRVQRERGELLKLHRDTQTMATIGRGSTML